MRDKGDRYRIQTAPLLTAPKRLGGYLVDAGLLTLDQINVVLNDQQATGMRFGEIIVARGWLKEQTIEWIMEKVVEPERCASQKESQPSQRFRVGDQKQMPNPEQPTLKQAFQTTAQANSGVAASSSTASPSRPFVRRDVPISKPLPPVKSLDGDVNWVG
jgi:hypothetical protein